MPEFLEKLRPDRDLQCFFYQPSAIAALSAASSTGFTVSGTWRQQFDWAVIEWNRDNVYEHPAFRCLPDGDLSGLTLTYDETRANCIPLDSELFATVDWPSLRVWATPPGGVETIYYVPLMQHAAAIAGAYACAYADFTLSGTAAGGDYVGLAFLTEHYTYQLYGSDTLASAVDAIAASVNAFSSVLKATVSGTTIRLYYTGGTAIAASTAGANGNRVGVYSYTVGSAVWDAPERTFAGGTSPAMWRVTLPFASLQGTLTTDLSGPLYNIPTDRIRKMRWTYAADLQAGEFARSEFQVTVSNWTVTGSNRGYVVAGPGSFRVENWDDRVVYSSGWGESRGNYSGGSIHNTLTLGASLTCTYDAGDPHELLIGLRYLGGGATASIVVDGSAVASVDCALAGEDVLIRYPLGARTAGPHTVTITHAGPDGVGLWVDFMEGAIPVAGLPVIAGDARITLATDWDTLHSISIAPERTAWMLQSMGFTGRANHYVGALWFYELTRIGHQYASGTVTFSGTPDPNYFVTLTLGRVGQPTSTNTVLQRLIHVGDTAQTIAASFAQELNRGYTGLWASASGGTLTIQSRSMDGDGELTTLDVSTTSSGLTATASGTHFADGNDGDWRTDLAASPRLNRALRDWSVSYYQALLAYGIDVAAAFSTELQHGDPSAGAGIAQMGPAGDPFVLPTPALQTNFSPASLNFWKEVYADMAALEAAAGLVPYLQFGEVQWWYFPHNGYPAGHLLRVDFSGMPFYDAWSQSEFQALYGHSMAVITTNTPDPVDYPDEAEYLAAAIGNFTDAIMNHVRLTSPECRFEVLYPVDVNQTPLNQAINYPVLSWTPAALEILKTEAFGFTFERNLNKSQEAIGFGVGLGFADAQRSHLVGIGDFATAWQKEANIAMGRRFESAVLFALDQFCLIGYKIPVPGRERRSFRTGS